jgi:Flp pilus assembly CpaE family ATPase
LTGLHYPDENIDIILNRSSRKGALNDREIEASLHREVTIRIPNNYELIVNAINAGTPIDFSRKSDLAVPLDSWADLLIGEQHDTAKESKGSRGLLSLFGSQSK